MPWRTVRPHLFKEPQRLAPLSLQALWLSGSFKSHRDAKKPIGLTLAATSGRDFCRMNQKLSALDL